MSALQYALIIAALASIAFFSFGSIQTHKYIPAGPILTPAEKHFFRSLSRAVRSDHLVFGKVRVSDLVKVKTKDRKSHMIEHARISQKHIDFVVVNKEDFEIVCAIELNDKSHKENIRRKRDLFLSKVFSEAEIPLVWIEVKQHYASADLVNELYPQQETHKGA